MYARALWDTIIQALFLRRLLIPRSFAALTVLVTTMSVSRRRAPLSRTNNRISDTRGTRKARRSVINGRKKEIKSTRRVPPRPLFRRFAAIGRV